MRTNKTIQWKQSAGGLFYPEEIKKLVELKDRAKKADGVLGIFEMPVDEAGQPIRSQARCLSLGENLIVNVGRESLRQLQSHTTEVNGASGTKDLGFLAVGDGSAGGSTVPQPGDTGLISELTTGGFVRPQLSVTVPPPGPPFTVNLWSAQIGTTELNGETINEAALFSLDNTTMFSFRTFANQVKSSGFVMEFRWSILF